MRKKIIIGNWKMNKNWEETRSFFTELEKENLSINTNMIAGVAVPSINIPLAFIKKPKNFVIAAQNISAQENGAFTGEISPMMLKNFDINYTIIGHSERRKYHNETNEVINKKMKNALKNGITPILCVGETLEEYNAQKSKEVVKKQLLNCLEGIDSKKVVVAYEPIWAIGTGKTATVEYASEMCSFIRGLTSEETLIQYGGSVSGSNIKELLNEKNIDGALVGGASLEIKSFLSLIK